MEHEHQLYVPVVKGKMWDLKALGHLSPRARKAIKPLVEAMPVPKDRSIDEHLEKFTHYILRHYPAGPVFVDFYGLNPGAVTSSGVPATIAGFRLLRKKGRTVTPTYGLQRDDAIWPRLRPVIDAFGRGFCFRIDIDDLDDQAENTWSEILERSASMGLIPALTDLALDLRDVRERSVAELKDLVIDFLTLKPLQYHCRSIVLVGSSALKTVTTVPKDGDANIQRVELQLWSELQVDLADSQRLLYGDYGVVHPEFSDLGANSNKNAKIRYTIGPSIRYIRGHRLAEPPGYKQYHLLAERVRNSSSYRGRAFSYGDAYIDDCADFEVRSGGLGTWVMVDMNHHLEYAALQVERLQSQIQTARNVEEARELLLVE